MLVLVIAVCAVRVKFWWYKMKIEQSHQKIKQSNPGSWLEMLELLYLPLVYNHYKLYSPLFSPHRSKNECLHFQLWQYVSHVIYHFNYGLYPQSLQTALDTIERRLSVNFRPDDDWSIQSKRRQVIFRTQVGNR